MVYTINQLDSTGILIPPVIGIWAGDNPVKALDSEIIMPVQLGGICTITIVPKKDF